jgi:hypothetical protein
MWKIRWPGGFQSYGKMPVTTDFCMARLNMLASYKHHIVHRMESKLIVWKTHIYM